MPLISWLSFRRRSPAIRFHLQRSPGRPAGRMVPFLGPASV